MACWPLYLSLESTDGLLQPCPGAVRAVDFRLKADDRGIGGTELGVHLFHATHNRIDALLHSLAELVCCFGDAITFSGDDFEGVCDSSIEDAPLVLAVLAW